MNKVKIVEVYGHVGPYDDTNYYPGKQTTWDEVTDEELAFLKQWVYDQNSTYSPYRHDCWYVLAVESKLSVPFTVQSAIEMAKKKKEAEEAKKAKAQAAAQKRAAKQAKKQEQEEKAKLRELLEKYPKAF